MKVDLGTCAVCGAKNSKFVESCYKCGAALPWAPNYVAPKPQETKPKSQSAPAPQPAPATPAPAPSNPTGNDAKTVVSPPLDNSGISNHALDSGTPPSPSSVSERANQRVPIPTWAIGAGVLGCVALGMALMLAFGNRGSKSSSTMPPPALAPMQTPAPNSATPLPTMGTVPPTTAAPSTTPPATVAPTTTAPASTAPATAPTMAPSAPTAAPAATTAPVAQNGPAFDALYTNTMSGTKEQKEAYWKTVENTQVSWRGDFVSLGASPQGPLAMRCKKGNASALVTVTLSTTPAQTLPPMQPNQSITVTGVLKGYSPQGYQLDQGRVG